MSDFSKMVGTAKSRPSWWNGVVFFVVSMVLGTLLTLGTGDVSPFCVALLCNAFVIGLSNLALIVTGADEGCSEDL